MSFRQVAAYFLATTLAVYAGISLSSSSISRGGGVECAQPQQFYESPLSTIEAPLNLTFSQLSDFLLDNYDVDGEDNTTSWDERIYDAFLAMELAETDGNPVPIHHHPYLFVGSAGPTFNRQVLHEYGITHIIGLSQSINPRFPDEFVYLSIQDVEDGLSANISRYFRPTTAFIENVKAQNGKVLVHCWQGVSRSVTIIIAYLMKAEHIKYKRALQLVRQTRPEADPNSHFVEQLKNYEKTLFHE